MVHRDVGHEGGLGEGRDGGPAGCFLVRDGGSGEEVRGGGGMREGDGRGAEGGVGGEEGGFVFRTGDDGAAEEEGGAGWGGAGVFGGGAAVGDGEGGEEAGGVLRGVAFHGGEEHGLVLVEESLGDRVSGTDGRGALAEREFDEGLRERGEALFGIGVEAGEPGFGARVGDAGERVLAAESDADGEFAEGVDGSADHGQFGGVVRGDRHHGEGVGPGVDGDQHAAFDFEGRLAEEGVWGRRCLGFAIRPRGTVSARRGDGAVRKGSIRSDFQGHDGIPGGIVCEQVNRFGVRLGSGFG